MIFVPFFCFAQINESFLDGNFINNPIWTGTTANFEVNASQQLQSNATSASTSFLFTPSEAIENATWECWIKINYTTSSSNYASVYIISDTPDITSGCNGYYVQIGGTNDEVSLFVQQGTKKTKIIDGVDKRTDGNPVELKIKVTRDADGNFTLYDKLSTESEYFTEGTTQDNTVKSTSYFGLLYANTSTTGQDYFFDDILVTGDKAVDKDAPVWTSLVLEQPDKLILTFSEPMDFDSGIYSVDNEMGSPASVVISDDKTGITLLFGNNFERGKIYTLELSGLTDLAGNNLQEFRRSIGIVEPIETGDLNINEIMFENPAGSLEYMEFYNKSDKVLDVSGLIFTTRKTDGTLNSGNSIPAKTLMLPGDYLAVCEDADSVRNYYGCDGNIISTKWSALNNESATVVLTNSTKDTIYDELTYNVKWHHPLVKDPKGVSLEKVNPALPTQNADSWHSAASDVNYGTPGYKNSQYRDISETKQDDKMVWITPEAFSPDNDGVDDVCFIHYKTPSDGYMADAVILNQVGNRVFKLCSHILLSAEGELSWDGRTDSGKNANVGIYVLYFEMFNPTNGARKQVKLPIVVSSR